MTTPDQPTNIYPATWEEYTALPEGARAEYVDGQIVTASSPSEQHQLACLNVAALLRDAAEPGWRVNVAWAWKSGDDEFIPDVMVYQPVDGDRARYTGTPVLCVEVLSSNRANDYVTKVAKYAEAGVPNYWILDPDGRTLDVLALEGRHYRPEAMLVFGSAVQVDIRAGTVLVRLENLLL